MDKINWNIEGGFPHTLDDFVFYQSAVRSAFKALVHSILQSHPVAILDGCNITDQGSMLSIAQGYLAYDGEVWPVSAHQATKTGAPLAWAFIESFDQDGLKEFSNGQEHYTYIKRRAQLVATDNLPASYISVVPATLFKSVTGIIRERMGLTQATDWVVADLAPPAEHIDNFPVQYRKDANNDLLIRGRFTNLNSPLPLFTLPDAFNPGYDLETRGLIGGYSEILTIYGSGTVYVQAQAGSVIKQIEVRVSLDARKQINQGGAT